jgi:hypothetical protein
MRGPRTSAKIRAVLSSGEKTKVDFAAYTRREFCDAFRIGHSKYFELKAEGLGPREMRIGRKILISRQSAEDWREMMERLCAAKSAEAPAG